MKRIFAILLALMLIASAAPALAFTYEFGSVDDNQVYDSSELIGNWIGLVEGWNREAELDIGDLVISGVNENPDATLSAMVTGGVPLRSYIVDADGVVRVFDLVISNEPENIYPPDAPSKVSTDGLNEQVEGFEGLSQLFVGEDEEGQPVEIDQTELDEFKHKYATQLENVYTAVTYYMKAAGYGDTDYGDLDSVGLAVYLASKYFPIADELEQLLNDTENEAKYIYICSELYKGFYATFLRDEVTMAEFSTVVYLWSINTDDSSERGSPYAIATYVPSANKWVLVDIFQINMLGDNMGSGEIMNIMIDIRYLMSVTPNTLVIGLRYNEAKGTWQISGMNRAAYLLLAQGKNLASLENIDTSAVPLSND